VDEFLRYVVQQLAAHPGDAVISHHRIEGGGVSTIALVSEDMGRLIGKGGATIKAIRDLISASNEKRGLRCSLEITQR
jgi:hypothetical protein